MAWTEENVKLPNSWDNMKGFSVICAQFCSLSDTVLSDNWYVFATGILWPDPAKALTWWYVSGKKQ